MNVVGTGDRLALWLSAAATAACFVTAGWMMTLPMMSGGRHPTIGEAVAMVAVPAAAGFVASWAAWRRRRGWLIAATTVVGLFAFVTGFSIGGAFYPALGLLVWAIIASIDAEPGPGQED